MIGITSLSTATSPDKEMNVFDQILASHSCNKSYILKSNRYFDDDG